jgi:very-short-patch-repair endonuclease
MIPITISYPAVCEEWHPTKNGDLIPDQVSAGMNKKVWWLCPKTCVEGCLHEWEAFVGNRCRGGYGCPFCSSLTKRVCVHTSIVGTHPFIAAQWHPTKNGDLKPENFSYGSEKKVWWLCPKTCAEGCPHEWEAELSKRILRGIDAGCPYCASNHKSTCIHTSIVHTHPAIAAQWHPEKNGTLKPEQVTSGCGTKIWWLCPNTCEYGCKHEWVSRVTDRVQKDTDCPQCCTFLHKICVHQSIAFTHSDIVKEWHSSKNGELKPEQYSFGADKLIWWQCKKNSTHIWKTAIRNRCGGNNSACPQCMNKTEEKLFNYLAEKYIVVRQFKIEACKRIYCLPFDIFIPAHKVIIEMDGAQHFRQISNWLDPIKTLRRDIYKMQQADKERYKVIRVCQDTVSKASEEWLLENIVARIESADRDHVFISLNEDLYNKHIELYSSGATIDILNE